MILWRETEREAGIPTQQTKCVLCIVCACVMEFRRIDGRWAESGDNAAGYCALHSRSSSPQRARGDMGWERNTSSVALDDSTRGSRKHHNSGMYLLGPGSHSSILFVYFII